jgi:dTDP-4-amino-4,6-dideoxygalactose transaminase
MAPILELAGKNGVAVVEDAAQALSARYRAGEEDDWVRAGALGTLGCYSFFPSKNLGAFGDGGAVVTSDEELAEKVRLLRVHGGRQMYHHRWVGWNSRLDSLQAAVLRIKLPRLDGWSRGRADNAARYDLMFADAGLVESGHVVPPARSVRCDHIYNQYTLRVRDRDGLRKHLQDNGVGHSVYYPVPLHLQDCFRELGYVEGDFPVAEKACREVISLPVYPELTGAQIERVVEAVTGFYRGA